MAADQMDKVVSLCKRRGFIYPGSEIYGGLSGTWDYGPLGVELKNNIKALWWQMFVRAREDMYGVDAAILMNPKVWEASGHVQGFSDPLVECGKCKSRFRSDQLISDKNAYIAVQKEFALVIQNFQSEAGKMLSEAGSVLDIADKIAKQMERQDIPDAAKENLRISLSAIIEEAKRIHKPVSEKIAVTEKLVRELMSSTKYLGLVSQTYLRRYEKCGECGAQQWSTPQQFNMMFKTQVGATEDPAAITYLRPETAGGIFVNFKNVVDSFHPKLPFGIAQIGKAFRNEIAPRDFIFRVRELEQMEIEYFVRPSEWEKAFEEWRENVHRFNEAVGIPRSAVHELEVPSEERAHYSKRTIDFEFDWPFGRKELYGLAYRTDFDLAAHAKGSSTDLSYLDETAKERVVPHVIEPSFGVDRTILAVLLSAYVEDELGGEKRTFLKFNRAVAPVKAAVFPLLKNKPQLVEKARAVFALVKKVQPQSTWDDNGNIGKRYRRQDEIGTPQCITIDFQTLEDDTVTIRDRDSGEQKRVAIGELTNVLA